jgi:hypothetical protein
MKRSRISQLPSPAAGGGGSIHPGTRGGGEAATGFISSLPAHGVGEGGGFLLSPRPFFLWLRGACSMPPQQVKPSYGGRVRVSMRRGGVPAAAEEDGESE